MQKKSKENKRVAVPRYQQIAVEIAERVVEGRYKIGEKIHARSTLATNFNVSPETARRAINVLVDLEIMEVRHGSGAYVSSLDNAQKFVEKYRNVQTVKEIQHEIIEGIKRQTDELDNFRSLLTILVDQTKQVQDFSPFIPYELELTSRASSLEKSIVELNLWHETGATIVAIQTETQLLLSPGPYAKLSAGNTLFFVGTELSYQRMRNVFYPEN